MAKDEIDSLYETPEGEVLDPEKDPVKDPENPEGGTSPTEPPVTPSEDVKEEITNDDTEKPNEVKESVLTQFLKNYGVMDGKITFDDESQMHIDELEPEKQLKVINDLIASQKSAIENQYGLSEDEIKVLNKMRTENKNFDQIIDEVAEQRLKKQEEAEKLFSSENFQEMKNEDIFKRYLKENNKEMTEEEIDSDLETAKKLKNFEQTVDAIRNQYILKQENEKNKILNEQKEKRNQNIENNARSITQIAEQIDEIAGWPIDDDMKNEVLGDLVEIDENDFSNFTKSMAQDPKKMFENAWLSKYAPVLFERMDTYYKKEVENAFEKGKTYALNNPQKSSGIKPDDKKVTIPKEEKKKTNELDSLYD